MHHSRIKAVYLSTLVIFGLTAPSLPDLTAATSPITVMNSPLRVGDAALIKIDLPFSDISSASFAGKKITPFVYKQQVYAFAATPGRELSGMRSIKVQTTDGKLHETSVFVSSRIAKVINLSVPPQLNNTPKQLVQNLETQKTAIVAEVQKTSDAALFGRPFGLPLSDNRTITSRYGEIRKTGAESIRHLGTDFVMKRGASVYAINDGVVLKAYLDPTYGKTVIIDHGARISSLYMHLDSILVQEGEKIKQGRRIGTLGKTGYASAEHLHLSIKIDGESIDPLSFIKALK